MLRRLASGDVPNTVFPSSNSLGIPDLRLDRQATMVDLPFTRWGRATRKSRMRGTWHFYTEDYRFSAVWGRPQVVPNSAAVAAVEPNFSVHAQTPGYAAIWQTGRKRWLARWWQEEGMRVLVDLHVAPEHQATNLVGVPPGWRAYATRGSGPLEEIEAQANHANRMRLLAWLGGDKPEPLLFVVYGGGRRARELSQARGWLWFPEEADEARGLQPS